jgi:two-component system chemotaxis response regulator CheB
MPQNHDIIVIGASAGGIEALQVLVAALPEGLSATVFIVAHLSPGYESRLAQILGKEAVLPVLRADDGKRFRLGHIYVAINDHHLLIEKGRMLVVRGPKENRHRPAIDPLFRSAALYYGTRTIGVILSGMLEDGTSGLWQIKRVGGLAVVQSPENAQVPQMPLSAIQNVDVDHVVPVEKMGTLLSRLTQTPIVNQQPPVIDLMNIEDRIAKMHVNPEAIQDVASPSPYTCPECHGNLFEVQEGDVLRYRCRTGHAYGQVALLESQSERTEEALWAAMRALQEKSQMLRQKADRHPKHSDSKESRLLAKAADSQAATLRQMIRTLEDKKRKGNK